MKMPKRLYISLVIPAYNEESHLAECLAGALAQTVPFDEIIVVDNNSTDATARIVAGFPGVKLMRETRQGVGYARTRGFDAARGDIIARIDADTVLPAGWAAHVRTFYTNPAHAQTAWTSSGQFRDVPMQRVVSSGYRLVSVHINRGLTGYPTLWGSSMALPRSLWREVAPQLCAGHGFHEDLDLTTHLHRAGYGIFYDKSICVTALLRHAWTHPRDLWEYLQWWPRTLRRHRQKMWVICWLGGTLAMFAATVTFAWFVRQREQALAKAPAPRPTEV